MAQYLVLRPVEYNGKLFVPVSEDAPSIARSAGNGNEIPVDKSGVLELPEELARQFTLGQVAPAKPKAGKSRADNK
jgi:hypothetical protein